MGAEPADGLPRTVLDELGMRLVREGEEAVGEATVREEMWSPGTTCTRVTVAATWADAVLGMHAIVAFAPRLPTPLDLDVHLFDEVADAERILMRSRLVKAGSSVVVSAMDFRDQDGRLVGVGGASFMVVPDPSFVLPPVEVIFERFANPGGTLTVPLAERIGCTRDAPGVASLPCGPAVHNGSKAINGGLLTLAVEEAALTADPDAARIESVHVRYLRAIRTGPAVARADVHHHMGRVEVTDASTGKVAAIATTRSTGA